MPRSRCARTAPRVETLESRTLLSADTLGMWPLRDPGPDSAVLVRFADGTSDAAIGAALAPLRGKVVQSYPEGPSYVSLGEGISPDAAVAALEALPFVRYAEQDATIHVDAAVYPNDPQFGIQWGLNNANNVDVDAPEAWTVSAGTSNIVVAVIDSGIDATHPDLVGQLWTDPKTGLHGWNFMNNSADIRDFDGHGTHVSGIIAASAGNGQGVAGVAPGVKIMPLKFIGNDGNGDTDRAVQAIYYAIAHGAKVINASWGGSSYSQSLHDAIAYANSRNVVFVTAAGNESANNDVVASYPALDRLPNALSVAAVDVSGNLADFSNYGRTTVDIAAPGVDIRSTVPGRYDTYSGTSMATPFVAGVAALVFSVHPGWTAAQVVHQIDATAKPLASLSGKTISGGMVDAASALGLSLATKTIQATVQAASTMSDDAARAQLLAGDEFYLVHGATPQYFVQSLYVDLLGREADLGGLYHWMSLLQAGASRMDVVTRLMATPEAIQTKVALWFYRAFGPSQPLGLLKVQPTVTAVANLLLSGKLTDADVQAAILASDLAYTTAGANPIDYIAKSYNLVFGRTPDTNGLLGWVGQLLNGTSRSDIARALVSTPEAKQTLAAGWFSTDLNRPGTLSQLKAQPDILDFSHRIGG